MKVKTFMHIQYYSNSWNEYDYQYSFGLLYFKDSLYVRNDPITRKFLYLSTG